MNNARTLENASIETIVALDALEAKDPRAATLMVGMPVTICIGAGMYPARIQSVSASLKTIKVERSFGKVESYRLTSGGYYTSGQHKYLQLGTAEYQSHD